MACYPTFAPSVRISMIPLSNSMEEDFSITDQKLNRQTLVLNKGFLPIQLTTVRHAIELLCQERAKVVDRNYVTYTLDQWMVESAMQARTGTAKQDDIITTVSAIVLIPKVITLTEYETMPRRVMRFRRRDVFTRDDHTCQYCGDKFPPDQLTLDHVVPRSRGGATTWENCVTSCRPCNTVKADRTPQEAGMKLIGGIPKRPNAGIHFTRKIQSDDVWKQFI